MKNEAKERALHGVADGEVEPCRSVAVYAVARIEDLEKEMAHQMRVSTEWFDRYMKAMSALRYLRAYPNAPAAQKTADERLAEQRRNQGAFPVQADREPPILEANNDRPPGADGPLSKRQLVRRPAKTDGVNE